MIYLPSNQFNSKQFNNNNKSCNNNINKRNLLLGLIQLKHLAPIIQHYSPNNCNNSSRRINWITLAIWKKINFRQQAENHHQAVIIYYNNNRKSSIWCISLYYNKQNNKINPVAIIRIMYFLLRIHLDDNHWSWIKIYHQLNNNNFNSNSNSKS